jgi:hypothetical protein
VLAAFGAGGEMQQISIVPLCKNIGHAWSPRVIVPLYPARQPAILAVSKPHS